MTFEVALKSAKNIQNRLFPVILVRKCITNASKCIISAALWRKVEVYQIEI